MWWSHIAPIASLALLSGVLGSDILSTNGFSDCNNSSSSFITVHNVDISFSRSNNSVTFDVSGSSSESQDVTATLIISAYGVQVYSNTFDPCDASTKVDQLCPVPKGDFSAVGTQTVPSSFVSEIPSIAYSVPDLEGSAKMILKNKEGQEVACIQSTVDNGKTVEIPAVSYVAAAIAAAALALSLAGAAMTGSHPGSSSSSPGFSEVMFWFQGMAMNGMHSVPYPTIYRSFTKNFAFSTGLIPWVGMQNSIDSFRQRTGGNTTIDNYEYLHNATLVFSDGSTSGTTTDIARRGLGLLVREVVTSINSSSPGNSTSSGSAKNTLNVSGISAYVEQLTIPQANTFMTVLLIFAIVVAAIVVGILLFKVILEAWALFASFPKSLSTFRKEYWRVMFQTITNLILLLYGVWTLYCIFQFTHGDSWAAKLLAGLTLGIFTGLLGFYTVRIFIIARKLKKMEGDSSALYENKETWKKYKLFYENYKKGYWWIFVPAIVYMFAKGCVLASADGHGLVQTAGQLIIESLMLGLLWSRPYNRKSGNWINIIIQVVRVASVVCILVFVEELGIAQSTKTITGVVLIAVQSALTAILAILIAVNSLISCFKENPHRRRRKAMEKSQKAGDDNLTAFDDNDPFLMQGYGHTKNASSGGSSLGKGAGYDSFRSEAMERHGPRNEDGDHTPANNKASLGKGRYRSVSRGSRGSLSPPPMSTRQPTIPRLDFGNGGYTTVPNR